MARPRGTTKEPTIRMRLPESQAETIQGYSEHLRITPKETFESLKLENELLKSHVYVTYGGGTNSTALLLEFYKRGIVPELIIFADTGGEKPHTYGYIEYFSNWLLEHGFPKIEVVRKTGIIKRFESLEEYCLRLETLPAMAFGQKTCSQKFKIDPSNRFVKQWIKSLPSDGKALIKINGFDADESYRYEKQKLVIQRVKEPWIPRAPLITWGIGRDRCVEIIQHHGLKQPGKSSCFFCPSMKKTEIFQLKTLYPDLANRALTIEKTAIVGSLERIKGLGRNFSWQGLLESSNNAEEIDESDLPVICECYDG